MAKRPLKSSVISRLRSLPQRYSVPILVGLVVFGLGVTVVAVPSWNDRMPWAPKTNTNQSLNLNSSTQSDSSKDTASQPTLIPRQIDGILVGQELANEMPVAIMIDNVPGAWPQSGLEAASVIYETLVEGGATRLMAVFAGGTSNKIGPIRSARPYYLDWVSEYDAFYGHVGGSPDALGAISGLKIKDFSQMRSGQYFWRDKSQSSPHNVYTSSELITRALRDQAITTKPSYESWKFKDESPVNQRPNHQGIVEVKFSNGNTWTSQFKYSSFDNAYQRFEPKDTLQTYADSGQPIKVKNVVVQIIPKILAVGEAGRLTLDVSGKGRALVFRDGLKIEGTWKKADRLTRTKYYDTAGQEIELNRGTTWVHIVPVNQAVTYTE